MRLSKMLHCLDQCTNDYNLDRDLNINRIHMDSRKITNGDLFVAIPGCISDGHDFIEQAIENGASAVVGEQSIALSVPYIQVIDSRIALGKLASTYFGYPSKRSKVIGITGTNGKTTVSYMLKHILESAGKTTSLFGTVSYIINNEVYDSINTTPDALQLQEMLAKSMDEYVILEVSSHALVQARTEGLEIDFGLFTNLSHDHLDYHRNMNEYFEAKTRMFDYLKPEGIAMVSELSPWGEMLSSILREKKIPVLSLGCSGPHNLLIENIKLNGKTQFSLSVCGEKYKINLPCPGLHNVYNAALAFYTAYEIGIDPLRVVKALEHFPGVSGRFEMVTHPNGATFIIDLRTY